MRRLILIIDLYYEARVSAPRPRACSLRLPCHAAKHFAACLRYAIIATAIAAYRLFPPPRLLMLRRLCC